MSLPPADFDAAAGAIDLAGSPSFAIGSLHVRPSTREVVGDGGEVVAEPRVLQVLITLAAAQGAVVSRDTLVRRCWKGRIVGEDAINRSIAKARALAELTQPPAFTIETIPRVGYRLRAAASTGPAPLASKVSSPLLATPGRRALLVGGGAAAAVVATVGGAVAYRHFQTGPTADPLVAVLPFDNLSSDAQLGYFADGLSEDILNALTRGGGLRVTARSSSFTFRGAAKAKAGTALGAGYLLDGSVLRDGARLRVNAHLSDVHSGETLWSDSFDREIAQGLQLEDEIAAQVAAALKVRLTNRAAKLIDPAVYELYLKGREALRSPEEAELARGIAMLREAVRRAPGFAAAWFELAKPYWRDAYLHPLAEQERGFALGREAAGRAVALDPGNGAALALLAQMSPFYNHWGEIEAAQTRALRLSPAYPELMIWRGWLLLNTGRLSEAAAMLGRGQSLDPFYVWANQILLYALIYTRRFAQADALTARIASIWPTFVTSPWDSLWLLAGSGRELEAAARLEEEARRRPNPIHSPEVVAAALRASVSGSQPQKLAAAKACLELAALGVGYATNAFILLCKLGRNEEAVAVARAVYLRKGPLKVDHDVELIGAQNFPQHGEARPYLLFHPFAASLRRSGGLDEIFDGIGLTAFWRQVGKPRD